ncbi:hypothetical protein OE88DRAFT_1810517 [Heliocybe sulcata]|uniref:Uncharacterized protein n=1 Tax=Heliocybe sulcata TaxID=5364 RepID=A0A5C3MWS2_9AGAM|nr:hypothetical protein OE88DRAFT_1810517 [Heliocybe sulcata]
MSGKTLSNGTLGLRFMQRAKLAQQADADKAAVKDESQWEIASAGREAYASSEVTYEASYLPFLFPTAGGGASAEVKGRRRFAAGGQETPFHEGTSQPPEPALPADDKPREWSKSKRPATISGSGTVSRLQKDTKANGNNARTAKAVIHETAAVGTDLRAARAAPNVFLKPSGVDEPAAPPKPDVGALSQGAKRTLDSGGDGAGRPAEKKRRKKRKDV